MWYAVLDEKGNCYSVGDAVASVLPKGWTVLELGEDFDSTDKEWDAKLQQFVTVDLTFPTPQEAATTFIQRLLADPALAGKVDANLEKELADALAKELTPTAAAPTVTKGVTLNG